MKNTCSLLLARIVFCWLQRRAGRSLPTWRGRRTHWTAWQGCCATAAWPPGRMSGCCTAASCRTSWSPSWAASTYPCPACQGHHCLPSSVCLRAFTRVRHSTVTVACPMILMVCNCINIQYTVHIASLHWAKLPAAGSFCADKLLHHAQHVSHQAPAGVQGPSNCASSFGRTQRWLSRSGDSWMMHGTCTRP